MTSTWPEDGVDDSGERMYLQQQQNTINSSANDFTMPASKISASSSPPSSTAALKFFSRNIMLASASNHNASSSTIGRQRQVQHLREVHRLKMETLKNERPEGTENDNQDSSDDDDDADIASKKFVKFPLAHKNLTQDTDDTAFLKMVRSTKSTSSSAATKSGKNSNRRKESKNENAENDVLVDANGSDSSCESENSFHSNEATPSEEDLNTHQGTTATTKQVTFATSVGNNKTQQMQQSRQNHHHQHHQQSNFSGSSQISSSEAATPSILDIGSDKMPLRFFPDQRTTSGWRGVVRPTGGGMIGYHHLKNQIARNQQQQSAQHQQQEKQGDANKPLSQGDASASSTTTVSTSNVNLQGSVAKSTVVSNFVNNNHKINNNNSASSSSSSPKTQNQIRASTPTQQKSSNATSTLFSSPPSGTLAGRNTPNTKNRLNLPPMSPSNNMTNRNSPSNSTRQQSKSLVKDHLTVFNTFREPIPVPNSHKHRNANPTQESITKALPTPKSDVDVAVLAPRSSKFVAGGTKNNKLIIRSSSNTNNSNGLIAPTHGNSSASSSMRSTYNNNNNNNDIIADVRLVILDDIHQNLHRAVSRQMEYSPQRLPRKRQETAKILLPSSSSSPKNPRKNSNRNLFSDYDAAENDHNNFASSTTTTTADANLSTTNKPNPKKSSSSPPAITAAAKTYVDDSDDDDLLLMQGGDFVSIADEKVVVGGDVVGGDPLLLPKMRGRWDAMRDAIKARYFAKEAPPVEPIAHALRHLPLPELCSMYRRAVKEVKGALEMTRRIFDSLVKVMLRTLPGNPTVTEDEVTKMYYVFDMNGNGSISFIEFLTTVVDFQTDRKETNFLRQVFNNLLLASDQKEAVATEDLSARAPWKLLEDGQVLFDAVLRALDKSYRFPRVVEKTFCDVLASSMLTARKETESALCQESYDGLFWEQFRLLVCLDPELMIPLRTIKLKEV